MQIARDNTPRPGVGTLMYMSGDEPAPSSHRTFGAAVAIGVGVGALYAAYKARKNMKAGDVALALGGSLATLSGAVAMGWFPTP